MLSGTWSRKMNHSASPRNRSSRRSREPERAAWVVAGFIADIRNAGQSPAPRAANCLAYDLLLAHRLHFVCREAADIGQDGIRVLAERRRRARVVDRRVGEAVVRSDDLHVADPGMLVGLEHAAALHLGLVERFLHGADRSGRQMAQL